MKFEYKKLGKTPEGETTIKPIIPITLRGNNEVRYEVLVDSGADICIFDVEIGELLGLDVKKGRKVYFVGVTGSQRVSYMHRVNVELGGKKYRIQVAFASLPGHSYGIVGQRGFFELFKVIFDYNKGMIELREKTPQQQALKKAA